MMRGARSLAALAGFFLLLTGCAGAQNDDHTDVQSAREELIVLDTPSPQSSLPADKASQTGGQCGGIVGYYCKDKADFCAMQPGSCQMADGFGTCTRASGMCTKEYRPVCGCDGKTYSNACMAAGAWMNIDFQGACEDGLSRR